MLCKLNEHGVVVWRIVAGHPADLDKYKYLYKEMLDTMTRNTYFVTYMEPWYNFEQRLSKPRPVMCIVQLYKAK